MLFPPLDSDWMDKRKLDSNIYFDSQHGTTGAKHVLKDMNSSMADLDEANQCLVGSSLYVMSNRVNRICPLRPKKGKNLSFSFE